MVVKHNVSFDITPSMFESSVISYGSKTRNSRNSIQERFESSVISYGSKTPVENATKVELFESSVISYGSKTKILCNH